MRKLRTITNLVLVFGLTLFGAVASCHAMGMTVDHGANVFPMGEVSSALSWFNDMQPCCRIVSPGMQATLSSRAAVKESAAGLASLLLAGAALMVLGRYPDRLLLIQLRASPVIVRDPSPPHFLQEAFSRGILNPKVF